MKESPKQEDGKMSRRGFLAGILNTAIVGGAGYAVLKKSENLGVTEESTYDEYESIDANKAVESVEAIPSSETFEAQKEGFKRWWTISFNEAQFLNEDGSPAGEPIPLEDVLIDDPVRPGEIQRISVGKKDKNGLIVGGIAGTWLIYHRDRLGLDIQQGEGKIKHTTKEFEAALQTNDEPQLVQSIKDAAAGGNGIDMMVDIVHYYGMNPDKKVRGDQEGRTRSEYLQQEITFHNKVPQLVQEELRRFIVGLAAQESRFNAGMNKNSETAWGIMQLIDDVRMEHGYPSDQKLSFKQEVDVAGKHFSNIYSRVRYWMKNELVRNSNGKLEKQARPETYAVLRGLFPQGQEGDVLWQKYFLTPCMVNAYNAGEWTMGACLHEFVAGHTKEELQDLLGEPPGYDLFASFTKYSKENEANEFTKKYGDDSSEYFVSIAAATDVL